LLVEANEEMSQVEKKFVGLFGKRDIQRKKREGAQGARKVLLWEKVKGLHVIQDQKPWVAHYRRGSWSARKGNSRKGNSIVLQGSWPTKIS